MKPKTKVSEFPVGLWPFAAMLFFLILTLFAASRGIAKPKELVTVETGIISQLGCETSTLPATIQGVGVDDLVVRGIDSQWVEIDEEHTALLKRIAALEKRVAKLERAINAIMKSIPKLSDPCRYGKKGGCSAETALDYMRAELERIMSK